MEQFPEGWSNFLINIGGAFTTLTATIVSPTNNYTVLQGPTSSVPWEANYTASFNGNTIKSWTETATLLVTANLVPGTITLYSGYGTTSTVNIVVTNGSNPTSVQCVTSLEGRTLPTSTTGTGEEMHLPMFINTKSGVYLYRHGDNVQYNTQDDIYSHSKNTASQFIYELHGYLLTEGNINDPWIDPKDGKYWNMSIGYGAFVQPAINTDHEKYYMNMRWSYTTQEKPWYFGKKVWIKNQAGNKAVLAGILEFGPAVSTGLGAGASPEALQAVGAKHGDTLEFCWAADAGFKLPTQLSDR